MVSFVLGHIYKYSSGVLDMSFPLPLELLSVESIFYTDPMHTGSVFYYKSQNLQVITIL